MKPRLDSSPALFAITVVLTTVIHFPSLRCKETRPFDICGQAVWCGAYLLEYPFWGLGRPSYCGHPGFELTCPSDDPILTLDHVDYRVRDSDSITHIITLVRNDLLINNTCPQYLYNTSIDSTRFSANNFDQEDVSLFYGCQNKTPLAANYRFPCDVNATQTGSYFYLTRFVNVTGNLSVQCNSSITVPVDRSSADLLATPAATEIDLRSALASGFNLEWMVKNDKCNRCQGSNGICGSNATSPDVFACYCYNGNFTSTCNNSNESVGGGSTHSSPNGTRSSPNGTHSSPNGTQSLSNGTQSLSNGTHSSSSETMRKVIIGISCGITVIMFLLFVILCQKKWLRITPKGPEAAKEQIEIFIRNYGRLAAKRYKYSEIKKITNSFQDKLGQGGYGGVYKGQLPDGHLVAVKLLNEATEIGEDFINEVASISKTSHVNVVTLIGFCFEGKKRALLYEFMPNGSLDRFLRSDGIHLDWNTLFQIAKGIARGLEYLHRGCNTRIVHFDIKPHNILLNEEFVPKISDFGLAKLCKTKESIVSVMGARGTAGYMAPEVFFRNLGGASHKSDVYSYGMMVLEMTGARERNNASRTSTSEEYFPDWIYKQVEVGGNLTGYGVTTEEEEELARKMMTVSLWCIQSNPSDRPSISKVVEMLEGCSESLQVPPRIFESSPARPFQGTPASSTQSSSSERVSTVQGNNSLPKSHETVQ